MASAASIVDGAEGSKIDAAIGHLRYQRVLYVSGSPKRSVEKESEAVH